MTLIVQRVRCGFMANIHEVIDSTAGPQHTLSGLSHIRARYPVQSRRDCGQGAHKWTAQSSPHTAPRTANAPNIHGGAPARAWLGDSSTFQAFYTFGQFLSPRVFLTRVSGRRRIQQGKEKLNIRQASSETQRKGGLWSSLTLSWPLSFYLNGLGRRNGSRL